MEFIVLIMMIGSVAVCTIPIVEGATRNKRRENAKRKLKENWKDPLSDKSAHLAGIDKYDKKIAQKIICTSLKGDKRIEIDGIINSMYNPKEDVLVKGVLHDPSNTAGTIDETIYLYQPCVTINGVLVRPQVKDGVLSDDVVYAIKDKGEIYTFYVDKREVSSGLPMDYVSGSKHGNRGNMNGLSINGLNYNVVNFNDASQKKEFDEYIEDRNKDGLDNRDRYVAKLNNSRLHVLSLEIDKKFDKLNEKREGANKPSKANKPIVDPAIEAQKRRIELEQRANDMKNVGLLREHEDHYEVNGPNDNYTIGVGGLRKGR